MTAKCSSTLGRTQTGPERQLIDEAEAHAKMVPSNAIEGTRWHYHQEQPKTTLDAQQ